MQYPTLDDMAAAPTWENYVVAQSAQACLGQIPRHALAVGVAVQGDAVEMRFQLSAQDSADAGDMDSIAGDLEALLGPSISVTVAQELRSTPLIAPVGGVRWFYLTRGDT